MCSYVRVAERRISTYVSGRLLVGPVRISVQVPCGAGVALQRSTSMQQVRKLVSKKELKTVHGVFPYSFAHIARAPGESRHVSRNGYSWAPAGSHGSRTRWRTGSLHGPEQHKRSLPPRSRAPAVQRRGSSFSYPLFTQNDQLLSSRQRNQTIGRSLRELS